MLGTFRVWEIHWGRKSSFWLLTDCIKQGTMIQNNNLLRCAKCAAKNCHTLTIPSEPLRHQWDTYWAVDFLNGCVCVKKCWNVNTFCMRLYLASILCDTCHRDTRLACWPCTRDAFNDFCQGSLDCSGWLMKVLCSQLGPSMDAIRSLTLYPWYSPQHAKGCLLHAPPGCRLCLQLAQPP